MSVIQKIEKITKLKTVVFRATAGAATGTAEAAAAVVVAMIADDVSSIVSLLNIILINDTEPRFINTDNCFRRE